MNVSLFLSVFRFCLSYPKAEKQAVESTVQTLRDWLEILIAECYCGSISCSSFRSNQKPPISEKENYSRKSYKFELFKSDTGFDILIICSRIVQGLNLTTFKESIRAVAANVSQIKLSESISLNIICGKFSTKLKSYLSDKINRRLLGMNILGTRNAVIDVASQSMKIANGMV